MDDVRGDFLGLPHGNASCSNRKYIVKYKIKKLNPLKAVKTFKEIQNCLANQSQIL